MVQIRTKKIGWMIAGFFWLTQEGKAALFELPVLEKDMINPIFSTLAAGLAFKPMEPASDLGKYFGFYFGPSFTLVDAQPVSNIFSDFSLTYLPSADIHFGIGIPYGFTFEGSFIPSFSFSGTSFSKFGGAIKWTATRDVLSALPFDLAARIAYTDANLEFYQPFQGGSLNVKYGTTIVAGNVVVSKNFVALEPFAGLGVASQSSSLSGSGSASLFGSTFETGTQSYSASESSPWFQAGLLFKVFPFGIAFEYDHLFGVSTYNGKFSLRF